MEFLETNYLWLILLFTTIFIFVYKRITKNPDAVTSKYEANKTIKGNPTENENLIMGALKNAGFKKVALDKD